MKKLLLILLLLLNHLFAEVINEYPSQKLIDTGITIIDIRTPQEWKEDGLIRGAIPITFWYADGSYNLPLFLRQLKEKVKDGERFALICHVGSRTAEVADFLSKEYNMHVINLLGGMEHIKSKGYKTVKYIQTP